MFFLLKNIKTNTRISGRILSIDRWEKNMFSRIFGAALL